MVAVDVAIRLLGPTEVGSDRALSPRDRVVLSALCVQPGQAVPAEVLADALWGEVPPKSWVKIVQGSVMRLRRALGPAAIETTAGGYRIVLPAGQLDTLEFERLAERGRSFLALSEPQRAATTFDQALELWRGDPFPELADWSQGRSEGARLMELRREVEEDLVEAHLAAGRAVEAAAEARPLVAREPFRERRWALLATALYRTGRQGEALDVLRRAGRTLRDDLGLDPGPDLVRLEQRILQQDPSLLDVPNRIGGSSATCPYRGLRPFQAQDADLFFGRAAVVADAVRRLGEFPLLIVVGASGSGKSSLVRAGVLPAMARAGHRASMVVPGGAPAASLTSAIAELRSGGVLVVDQLEEVFTSPSGPEVTKEFLDRLAALVVGGIPVVATLRADYLGWLPESPELSRLAERGLLLLTAMSEQELREAIEAPARQVGLVLEPGLVDLLVRDVSGAPGGLPLLSHALAETWEQREGTVMTVDAYRSTGGIRSAVAQSAERLYESLPPQDREVLRSVLQRLVAPGPSGEPVAVRVPSRVFAGSPDAAPMLDLLIRTRLATTSEDTVTIAHESLVRAWPRLRAWLDEDIEGQRILAHLQVTADTWDSLGRPDDELYRGARLAAAREWRGRTHPVLAPVEADFLAAAIASTDAEHLRRERDHANQVRRNRQLRGALTAAIVLLAVALLASLTAGQAGRTARAEAARATAEASRADASAVAAIGARLADAALGAPNAGLSLLLGRQAVAISETPATQGALLNGLMNVQGLTGMAQSRLGPSAQTFDHAFTPDGRVLLHMNSRWELDLVSTTTGISLYGTLADSAWGNPSWRRNEAAYPTGLIEDGRVAVLSHERQTIGNPSRQEAPVELLPIDVGTGAVGTPQPVPGAVRVFGGDTTDHADRLRISADGGTIVSVLEGQVRIWQRRDERWVGPRSVPIPGTAGQYAERTRLVGVTFSTDGSRAAVLFDIEPSTTSHEPGAVVVDLKRARLLGPSYAPDPTGGLSHLALSPDGRQLLVGDAEGPVLLRRVADDRVLGVIAGQSPATALAWSPDGARVAIGRLDGTSEVHSLKPPRPIMTSAGPAAVSAVSFVGQHGLISVSVTGAIARYDLGTLSPVATMVPTAPVQAIDAAAGLLVLGGEAGRVRIRSQATLRQVGSALPLGPLTGRERQPEMAAGRRITALALTADGSAVIAADRLGHLRMWSLPGRELLWASDGEPTSHLAVSPDGSYLATVGNTFEGGLPDGDTVTSTFTIWDLTTHEVHLKEVFTNTQFNLLVTRTQAAPTPTAVTFSPDGRRVAVAFLDGFVMLYDVGQRRRTSLLSTLQTTVSSMAFSPDGKRILAASRDYLTVWDATTGAQLIRTFLPGLGDSTRMTFTDDGRWLAVSDPRSVTVLDAHTLAVAVAGLRLPTDRPTEAFPVAAGNGHTLFVGTRTVLASINMDPERWKSAACQVVGRRLTKSEWDRFLPSMPFAPACD